MKQNIIMKLLMNVIKKQYFSKVVLYVILVFVMNVIKGYARN